MGKRKRKTSAVKRKPPGKLAKRAAALASAPPPPPAPAHERNPSSGGTPSAPPPALLAIANELQGITDPLQGNALAHKALLATMADVLADASLTPAARRKELRVIAAAAKDLLPDARRWEVDQLIKQDQRALEAKSRQRRGAKLEPVPDEAPAAVLELVPDPPASVDFGGEVAAAPEPSASSEPAVDG